MKTKSQAAMIRFLLSKKVPPEKIVAKVKAAFPKQKPTIGYVNALSKEAA